MATIEQQSSPATALPMLVKKLNSSPFSLVRSIPKHSVLVISGDTSREKKKKKRKQQIRLTGMDIIKQISL